jgi:hypothetical protein
MVTYQYLKQQKMKTIYKLSFAVAGFFVAIAASSGYTTAGGLVLDSSGGECHGSGTCFVTAGGTTINGKWCEMTK